MLVPATADDIPALAALHGAAARRLTADFGTGPWSGEVSEQAVARSLATPQVYVARRRGRLIATLRLQTKKPWAIDVAYFSPVRRALYLVGMAVAPGAQRRGVGRACVAEAAQLARDWPAEAIRLDAWDAAAGAGPFYARCGFTERGRVVYRRAPLIYFELLL